MKTRAAVVGLGKMGLLHASILSILPDVQVEAVCEKSPLVRRFSRKALNGLIVCSDIAELAPLGLDTVHVTTPAPSHYPIIRDVYLHGVARHVFSEKPLASTPVEALELNGLADQHDGVNMVGYHRRFSGTSRKARELLRDGSLGSIVSFKGYAYSSDFLGAKSGSQGSARGGVLSDSGCHAIDLALWLLGDFTVTGARLESVLGRDTEDTVWFEVETRDSVRGEFECSWCVPNYRLPDIGLAIEGTLGKMRVNEDSVTLELEDGSRRVWHRHDLEDTAPFFLGGPEYYLEDATFIESIRSGTPAEPSFRSGLRVDQIVEAVKKSAIRRQDNG